MNSAEQMLRRSEKKGIASAMTKARAVITTMSASLDWQRVRRSVITGVTCANTKQVGVRNEMFALSYQVIHPFFVLMNLTIEFLYMRP